MTHSSCSISKPRAAISVAINARTFPVLNSSNARKRAPWLLSPLIETAFMPSFLSSLTNSSEPSFVFVNTRTCCQLREPIKYANNSLLRCLSTGYTICSTVSAVLFVGVTCISFGLCNM